jgi:hypothetical protein
MTRFRNRLLITLALVAVTASISVSVAHAYQTLWDVKSVPIGHGGVVKPGPDPNSGEPDIGGGQAPPSSTTKANSAPVAPISGEDSQVSIEWLRWVSLVWAARLLGIWR